MHPHGPPDTTPAEQPAGSGQWRHMARAGKAYEVLGVLGSTVCVPLRLSVSFSHVSLLQLKSKPTASATLKCTVQRPEARFHCRAGIPTRRPRGPSLSTS